MSDLFRAVHGKICIFKSAILKVYGFMSKAPSREAELEIAVGCQPFSDQL